jgi:serine/threonine protein kinase
MGTVYRAVDPDNDQVVAIKVMNAAMAQSQTTVDRFLKEARLLAEVNNPWVTNLLDSGQENGVPFMVLEFVDGDDLSKELNRRDRIPEEEAISIVADVARALIPAHERGIIHRDIKPGNILLTPQPEDAKSKYHVRLADFGLARHVDQSESMQLTKTGVLLGTPLYMSPEQCRGQGDIGPEADIYALGITLFALLTGKPPFNADDAVKLVTMHCLEPAPSVQQVEQSVTDQTTALVNRALAKEPADRFANAAEFLDAIQQIQGGTIAAATQHPAVPDCDAETVVRLELEFQMKSTRQQLWPYISHTERINEALGLPAVEYKNQRNEHGQLQRFGSVKVAGKKIEWEEHPFEWVEGARFGVLREFTNGPFHWLSAIVTFEDLPDGGTFVRKHIQVLPRGLVGRMLARFELGVKTKNSVTRVYSRIDQVLSSTKRDQFEDPWLPARPVKGAKQRRLNERTARFLADSTDKKIGKVLTQFLSASSAQEVSHIRPLEIAARLELDQEKFVRACLYAAKHELLRFQWDLICPTCRIPSESRDVLSEVQEHAYCEACDLKFGVDLGGSLELSFTAHPDIRDVETGVYCIGGPGHSPHVVAQIQLKPEEELNLRIQLSAGNYLLRGPSLSYNIPLHVSETVGTHRSDIPIGSSPPTGRMPLLKAGTQRLQVRNTTTIATQIRIERTIKRQHVLTARAMASMPEFRELFPLEIPAPGRLLSMSNLSILVCEFHSLIEASRLLGDIECCLKFTDLAGSVRDKIATHRGTVFRENDGALWASFDSEEDAVQVAAALLELNHEIFGKPVLVLHRGPVIATNRDQRLYYFGQTIHHCASGLNRVAEGNLLAIDSSEVTLEQLYRATDATRIDTCSSADFSRSP